jgi:uncharacterized repeat protein (TIGR01451 family)
LFSIVGSDAPDPVTVGSDLNNELDVQNAGPDPAQGTVLSAALPAGVTLRSTTPSAG